MTQMKSNKKGYYTLVVNKVGYDFINGLIYNEVANTEFGLDIIEFIKDLSNEEKIKRLYEYLEMCKLAYKFDVIKMDNYDNRVKEVIDYLEKNKENKND